MFWERFTYLCDQNKIKPNPLGKELGISSGVISNWKKTGSCPSGETLIKISNYFDCSIDFLVGRSNNMKSQNSEISENELDLIYGFREIPDDGKDIVINMIKYLSHHPPRGDNAISDSSLNSFK